MTEAGDVAAGAAPSESVASFTASVEEILAGSPDGLFNAAVDLGDVGVEQAREVLYRMAAARGVRDAWLNLAYVVLDSGRTDEGVALLGESARAGDPKGAFMYAQELEARGVLDDAARWYARADGVPGADMRRSRVLRALGHDAEALDVLRRAAADDAEAAVELVKHDRALTPDDAVRLLESHRDAGAVDVLIPLSNLYEERGDDDAALSALQASYDAGEPHAALNLGVLLIRTGREDEGREYVREAALRGDELARPWLDEG